jgi:hypothetical protein
VLSCGLRAESVKIETEQNTIRNGFFIGWVKNETGRNGIFLNDRTALKIAKMPGKLKLRGYFNQSLKNGWNA